MGSQGYYIKDNDTEVKEEIKNPETKETQNLNNEILRMKILLKIKKKKKGRKKKKRKKKKN